MESLVGRGRPLTARRVSLATPCRRVGRLIAAAGAIAYLARAAPARADDAADLERGISAFEAGRYEECASRFHALLPPAGPPAFADPGFRNRARMYYAACLIATKQAGEADRQMEQLVLDDTLFQPDRAAFPPNVVDRFGEVRRRLASRIEEIEKRERDRREAEQRRREDVQRREAERQQAIRRLAMSETVVRQNSRWVAAVPFGVGQFQNGQTGLGVGFLATEGLLAVASAGTSVLYQYYVSHFDSSQNDPQASQRRVDQVAVVNRATTLALIGVAALGVAHAELTFVPETRTMRERALPPSLSLGPAAAPVAGGAIVGVGGRWF